MTGQGSGRYSFDVGALVPGDYSFTGAVTSRGAQIGIDKGRFTVGELGLEEGASTCNVSLLQVLAQRTGGIVVSTSGVDELVRLIRADPRLRPVAKTSEREFPLYHLPWLIVLGILAFSLEWFLRKRRGLV